MEIKMMWISLNNSRKKGLSVLLTMIVMIIFITYIGCERQQESRKYVVGFVDPNPGEKEGARGFLNNMPKFGYIEGKNMKYIKSEGKKDIEAALKDMVSKHVDMIFTVTTPASKMAKKITEGTNIPVVFVVYDAVESGLVKSLIDPGGNLTGIQLRGSVPKTVEWLLKVMPRTKHIFVPVKFDTGAARMSMEDLKQSAAKSGLKLTVSEVGTAGELRASMSRMPKYIDAVFIIHSILIVSNIDEIIDTAIRRKIPLVSSGHDHYKRGALISYGNVDDRTGFQAARLANSILRGTPPADLPVEIADFSLGINLNTARLIGIEISNDILQQTEYIARE
jgi:putative ABC transport system substrate-binding protein